MTHCVLTFAAVGHFTVLGQDNDAIKLLIHLRTGLQEADHGSNTSRLGSYSHILTTGQCTCAVKTVGNLIQE